MIYVLLFFFFKCVCFFLFFPRIIWIIIHNVDSMKLVSLSFDFGLHKSKQIRADSFIDLDYLELELFHFFGLGIGDRVLLENLEFALDGQSNRIHRIKHLLVDRMMKFRREMMPCSNPHSRFFEIEVRPIPLIAQTFVLDCC